MNRRNSTSEDLPATIEEILLRRARRHARSGRYRKAAVALSSLANRTGAARFHVLLGAMWMKAHRPVEASLALRQGLFLHRQAGAHKRARTVARILSRLSSGSPLKAA